MSGARIMIGIAAAAALFSAPLAGQGSAEGAAFVVVPAVAELELQSASAIETRGTAGGTISAEGSLLVRVRANHDWRVLVEGQSEGVDVWWRATVVEEATPGDFRPLPPGGTAVAAEGGRGQVVIRIDYRWTSAPAQRYDAAPLMYTLASL